MLTIALIALAVAFLSLAVTIGTWVDPVLPSTLKTILLIIAVICTLLGFGAGAFLGYRIWSYKKILTALSVYQSRAIKIQARCNNALPGLTPLPPGRTVGHEYQDWQVELRGYIERELGGEYLTSFERVHGVSTAIPMNPRIFELVEQYAKNLDLIITEVRARLR
jgi:hypothetical protein